jgi:hypothetical protein
MQVARAQARVGSSDASTSFDLAVAASKVNGAAMPTGPIIAQRIKAGEFDRAILDINDLPKEARDLLLNWLVAAQANAGRIEDATASASSISSAIDRIIAMTDIAVADFRSDHAFAGAQLLAEAQRIASQETTPAIFAEAAAAMAGAEAVGRMETRSKAHLAEARARLETETFDAFKRAIAVNMVRALARAGQMQEAMDMLRGRLDPRSQTVVLSEVAADRLAAKQNGEAFAALVAIPVDEARGAALLEFAEKLPK